MKKLLTILIAVALASVCDAQSTSTNVPTIASIEIVYVAGSTVNYVLPAGSPVVVMWHVFLQRPSGKVDTVEGISFCDDGSAYGCKEEMITFSIPRDYVEGRYRLLGAKFFDHTVVLNDTFHVLPFADNGVDEEDAKFVAYRQSELSMK